MAVSLIITQAFLVLLVDVLVTSCIHFDGKRITQKVPRKGDQFDKHSVGW